MSRTGSARTPGMGFLRSIESGIEHVVDGTVGRVVRVSVQPVEIARKLAKELEDGKVEAGGRTLVPSTYTVYLPPKDRERFSEYEASLRVELGAYLAEHVRREGYSVRARPRVTFETANELSSGTFGIATEPEPPLEPQRSSIRVEPAPVATVPVEAVPEPSLLDPEPVQEALPDVLVAPGLEPDAEVGPADYEPVEEPAAVAPSIEPEHRARCRGGGRSRARGRGGGGVLGARASARGAAARAADRARVPRSRSCGRPGPVPARAGARAAGAARPSRWSSPRRCPRSPARHRCRLRIPSPCRSQPRRPSAPPRRPVPASRTGPTCSSSTAVATRSPGPSR